MSKSRLSRREFLKFSTITAGTAAVAACAKAATPTAEPVKPTDVPVVAEKPTEVPTAAPTAVPEKPTDVPAPKEVITVGYWNGDPIDFQIGYQAIVDAFNASHTDIKMENKNVPDNFDEKLLSMIAANDGPDIWMKIDAVSSARHGHFECVTPWLEKDGYDLAEHYFDLAWKIKLWDGKLWSLCRDVGWSGWAYNKNIFDDMGVAYPKNGWTVDEWIETAQKLTDKTKGYWGSHVSGAGALLWGSGSLTFNLKFVANNEDGTKCVGYLDSPTSIQDIQLILDVQDKYKVSPDADAQQALGGNLFGSAKVAVADCGTWDIKTQMAYPFKWEPVRAPVVPGNKEYTWGSAVQNYMWSGAKHKEEVWQAFKFTSTEPGSKAAMDTGAWLSPCPSVWKELGKDNDPFLSWFLDYAREAEIGIPAYEREFFWEAIGTPYFDIWTRYLENKERPLEAIVKDAAAKAQSALDEAVKKAG